MSVQPQLLLNQLAFNEPAKLAVRVLAPGDGEAEPGGYSINPGEPAKLATDAQAHRYKNIEFHPT